MRDYSIGTTGHFLDINMTLREGRVREVLQHHVTATVAVTGSVTATISVSQKVRFARQRRNNGSDKRSYTRSDGVSHRTHALIQTRTMAQTRRSSKGAEWQ